MKIQYSSIAKKEEPAIDRGMKVAYAKAKRGGYRSRWYLLILLLATPIVLMTWFIARPYLLVTSPGIITTDPLQIRSLHQGIVKQVFVKQGQMVQRGDVLLLIEDPVIEAQIAAIVAQKAALSRTFTTAQEGILLQMKNKIAVVETGAEQQKQTLEEFKEYRKRGLISVADTLAIKQYNIELSMVLEQAKADYQREVSLQAIERQAGPLAQLEKSYDLELIRLKSMSQSLHVRAPFSARVTDVRVQEGENIAEDSTLLWLSGRDQAVVSAFVAPRHLDFSNIGQQATVTLPNGERFRAIVSEPTELVTSLPAQLSNPFEGDKGALKVTLTPLKLMNIKTEGLPVSITFDRFASKTEPWSLALQRKLNELRIKLFSRV